MKKIQWAVLASTSVVAGAVVLSSTSRGTASAPAEAPAAPVQAKVQAPVVDAGAAADGFRPSEFAGVSVRDEPTSTSIAAGSRTRSTSRGWIALKPGEPRAGVDGAQSRGFTVLRKERGTTRLGGSKLVGAGLMHAEIATRDAKGRTRVGCVPGESQVEHQAHINASIKASIKASRAAR